MDDCKEIQKVTAVSEKLEKSLSIDPKDKMDTYNKLISDGKEVAKQGDIQRALVLFKRAYKVHQTPKLERRIKKIEELLAQTDLEDEDDEFVNVNNSGFMLFRELYDKLYNYQRDGVSFLYGLYRDGRKGGVLADDMGLGKTIQIISFLSGMYDYELVKHTLLVMPKSLIINWINEFAKWTPGMRVKQFHGGSRAEKTKRLEKVQRRGGIIITTYTMLMNNWQQVATYQGREFVWDYMILDEAHKIKNSSSKTAHSAYAIPSKNRILLTGTPVQNNLREMWTLFDFACQGTLLGTQKTFRAEFENPITRARERDATPGEKALGSRMSENLMVLIEPYFLRRTKSEVQKKNDGREMGSEYKNKRFPQEPSPSGATVPELTRKNDLVVWTYLSDVQEDIYRQFISLDHIKELLMTSRSPLAELTILKKLCDHPRLLSANAISKLGLEESQEDGSPSEATKTDTVSIANVSDETLISESGKLVFLLDLLEMLREHGHRTLIFAHFRKVLDILERILGNRGFKVLRLDGTITQITERADLISRFQNDKRYSVFLLTTHVGGVGITLTAADRVVIYDPSWNPATDAQAVDRAYRIGQTENVVIYRLITCSTVEEKIYRRQVFKDSLIRQNTGEKKNPFRYFSRQELKELFHLGDTRFSTTQLQLQDLHSRHRQTDPELDDHIAYLYTLDMFGISDHDLMFSLDVHHDEGPEDQEEHKYIEGRVQKAQELMRAECALQMQITESDTDPARMKRTPDSQSKEKKPKTPKPGSAPPQTSRFDTSPAVVDLDRSGPDSGPGENSRQDASPGQDKPSEHTSLQLTVEDHDGPSRTSRSVVDLTSSSPLQARTSSVPQRSDSSFRSETSRASAGLDSLNCDFNLQLDDSNEVPLDQESEEEEEVLEEEGDKLLLKLQKDGRFDVRRSLSESQFLRDSGADESVVAIVTPKKRKRAAVIYDSDEEQRTHPLDESLQVLGASTPKSTSSPHQSRKSLGGNTSVVSRRSLLLSIIEDVDCPEEDESSEEGEGGSVSGLVVAKEILNLKEGEEKEEEEEDEEDEEEEEDEEKEEEDEEKEEEDEEKEEEDQEKEEEDEEKEEEDDEKKEEDDEKEEEDEEKEEEEDQEKQEGEEKEEEGDDEGEEGDVSQLEPDVTASTRDETSQEEEKSFGTEESSGEAELASGEAVDLCAAESSGEPESYDFLVRRGKEFYSQAKLDDALSFFLRALDLQPGDPEVQVLTIQLYRQLSRR